MIVGSKRAVKWLLVVLCVVYYIAISGCGDSPQVISSLSIGDKGDRVSRLSRAIGSLDGCLDCSFEIKEYGGDGLVPGPGYMVIKAVLVYEGGKLNRLTDGMDRREAVKLPGEYGTLAQEIHREVGQGLYYYYVSKRGGMEVYHKEVRGSDVEVLVYLCVRSGG